MNRIILSVFLCLAGLLCHAEETEEYTGYSLQVLLNDSTIEEIRLEKQPVITFTDSTLVISTDSIVCELSEINKIIFTGGSAEPEIPEEPEDPETPTGIAKTPTIKISYANQILRIEGIAKEERITISNIQGMLQDISPAYESDNAIVELSHLPKGIYIIRIKNQTIKITIR